MRRTFSLLSVGRDRALTPKKYTRARCEGNAVLAVRATEYSRCRYWQAVRKLNPYREMADPVAWQREIREDVILPGRE